MSRSGLFRSVASTVYVGAAGVSVVAAAQPLTNLTRRVKPLLMPALLCTTVPAGSATDSALLAIGLTGGWVGDLILMGGQSRSADPPEQARNLNRGSAAFAVNQLAYHVLLLRAGARVKRTHVFARAPLVLAGAGLAAWKNPAALPAAAGYGSALALTSILARDYDAKTAFGADLFVLSDSLILVRLALLPAGSRLHSLADGAVMATYTAAQYRLASRLAGTRS